MPVEAPIPADVGVEQLASQLAAMALSASAQQCRLLLQYVGLLAKWNRVYNLTAIREPQRMLREHVLDSLSLTPYVKGPRVLDVGTGGGLPGVPLAILLPDIEFILLDANSKKTRFVQQVVIELQLPNVTVITDRVERYRPALAFDQIVTRAFSSLRQFSEAVAHLVGPTTELLAMKGKYPASEIEALGSGAVEALSLTVPGIEAERHLLRWRPRRGSDD